MAFGLPCGRSAAVTPDGNSMVVAVERDADDQCDGPWILYQLELDPSLP